MDKVAEKIYDSMALVRLVTRDLQEPDWDEAHRDDMMIALLTVQEKLAKALEEINQMV